MNKELKDYFDIQFLGKSIPFIHDDKTVCIIKEYMGKYYFNCSLSHEMRCSELQRKPGEVD